MRIDQWVPALHRGDAIGDSARLMRDAFRRWGHTADVYALELDADLEGDGRPWSDWRPGGPDDVVILHYALPSPLTAALRAAPRPPRAPPPQHHARPSSSWATTRRWCASARSGAEQSRSLAGHVDLALADSEFNRRELEEAGFTRTGVLPIYLDFARYREPPQPGAAPTAAATAAPTCSSWAASRPNKRQEDLVRLASYWKRFIAPDVRLLLVGKLPRRRHYFDALQALRVRGGLHALGGGASRATSTTTTCSPATRPPHVFVSHERARGLRRAARGVDADATCRWWPIARPRCRDTLGDAGVQFAEKRFGEMAEVGAPPGHRRRRCARPCSPARTGASAAFAPEAVEARAARLPGVA